MAHTILLYSITKPPEFVSLTGTKLMGTSETDIFIEMTWKVKNVSKFPFILDNTNLFFYNQELQIARVFFEDAVLINAVRDSKIKVNAAINRAVFEDMIRNSIEEYSFDLRGTVEARFLFMLGKELQMTQHIPINITHLLSNFLQDSFKGAIFFEQMMITETAIDCVIAFINRPGFEMEILSFDSRIQIGKTSAGNIDYFFPVYFRPDEIKKNTRIRFTTGEALIDRNFMGQYFVEGYIKVSLWEKEYSFHTRIIGDK
ncbi:MAG: hypothetical protein FWG20_06115 [Candidatus Cloacimonetes bacterium]|nr:hypothetical protein [Candidatus Cloacimonadota bacterium]